MSDDNIVNFSKKKVEKEVDIREEINNTIKRVLKTDSFCAYVAVVSEDPNKEEYSIQAFVAIPDNMEKAEELVGTLQEVLPKDPFVSSAVLNAATASILSKICNLDDNKSMGLTDDSDEGGIN